ncbi:MAG: Unknown protein [uncultured Thiotrichaceae bacterium]|uniref:Uncharacterized protein n=1 Tax=uncultured Thiotrichaceae bacterium TaxID=298394 RepID=A0A6S6U657_9GAMM|nr:MAG: Unknown protein [uncultured Thiotrichaceae bacterium]
MKIDIPSMEEQKRFVFEQATNAAIEQLQQNLQAPVIKDLELDESQFSNEHLLPEGRWKPPHPEIICAYLEQFKQHSLYTTDSAVVDFLGLNGNNGARRLRAYKTGKESPPFGVWRRLLVATGRVPQEVMPVLGFFG